MSSASGSISTANGKSCAVGECRRVDEHTHLLRYFFRLPDFFPVEDGTRSLHLHGSPSGPITFSNVTIHQLELDSDDVTSLSVRCSTALVDRLGLFGSPPGRSTDKPKIPVIHSVADVTTPAKSPQLPPADWNNRVENLTELEDPFMRALHGVRTVARAANLTEQARPVALPTYERSPVVVLLAAAVHTGRLPLDDPEAIDIALTDLRWESCSLMLLEHSNVAGSAQAPVAGDHLFEWMRWIAAGMPAVSARERFVEARRMAHVDGEYAAAVVAAATSVEVLSDSLLSALLWEEARAVLPVDWPQRISDAARLFAPDDSPMKRATKHSIARLGGDWSGPRSAWQEYRSRGAALRNRIVHAGYEPRRQEALQALQLALDAQSFLMDRLASRSAKYPRVVHLFLGVAGLERRSLFRGSIKNFFEQVAPVELPYVEPFAAWHRALIDIANEQR